MSSWARVSSVLPGVLAGLAAACARVDHEEQPVTPVAAAPVVAKLDPAPGAVAADARFRVEFSEAMDEAQLVAGRGASETVVLATQANVEAAVVALRRARPSAQERKLFVAARATVADGAKALELEPSGLLEAGTYFLLVSSRLHDAAGHKLEGNGARFEYTVAPYARPPVLLAPAPGAEAPANLAHVLVRAESGSVSLVDDEGAVVGGPVEAHGEVALPLASPLTSGKRYRLAIAGAAVPETSFGVSACRRASPVAIEGGKARLFVRESSVELALALDEPAELQVELTHDAEVHATGGLAICSPSPCAAPAFECAADVKIEGLTPATAYTLRVVARDLQGFEARTQPVTFDTAASVPRILLSEVMAAPQGPAPRSDGEYVELLNLGPGAAQLDGLALVGEDGRARPLLAAAPPLPVLLPPGGRALAVGGAFDSSRYPTLPVDTPVLRASTQRLLGRGLRHDPAPAIRLVLPGTVPVELASFPGGSFKCEPGSSLQRDETLPPDAVAPWRCGPVGGTPGRAP